MNSYNHKTDIIKRVYLLFFAAIVLITVSCLGPSDQPVSISWNGMWENDTAFWGTFTLDAVFEGERMDKTGGSGTVSGNIEVRGVGGVLILESGISGIWENDFESGYDQLEYTITSDDSRVEIYDFMPYYFVSELNDEEYTIGAFTLDSDQGGFHTVPSAVSAAVPDVISAVRLDISGAFTDITWIEGMLYGTVYDGNDYRLASIDPSDGTTEFIASSCTAPYAVCYDGTYSWLVDYYDSGGAIDCSLYKYEGISFAADETGYPVSSSDLNGIDAIDYYDSEIYFMFGTMMFSSLGTIDETSAETDYLLTGNIISCPEGMSRTAKIEVFPGGYYVVYNAPGGVWCRIQKIDTAGSITDYDFTPVNEVGPITVNGSSMYIIHYPDRLYEIDMS